MPAVAWWGISAVGAGLGIKFAGDGVEDTSKALKDFAVVAGVGAAVYLIAKHKGLLPNV